MDLEWFFPKGDTYVTERFWHRLAKRPDHRDHRNRALIRPIPFLSNLVHPGWQHALPAPGKGIGYRMVQKFAQDTDHWPVRQGKEIQHERPNSHRRGTGPRGR